MTDESLTHTITGAGEGNVVGATTSFAYGNIDTQVEVPNADVVSAGGVLSPGNSPGIMDITGDLDLTMGDSTEIEVQGTAGAGVLLAFMSWRGYNLRMP